MRRIVVIVSCLAALAAAGPAAAEPLGCGVSDVKPLWIEFADGTVGFRQAVFGHPGIVVATSGVLRAGELRGLGAQTVYWQRALKLIVGTPTVPFDPALVQEKVATLIANARASAGCATPPIGLNELWGPQRATPWSPEVSRYRANVLAAMRQLSAAGMRPFLLVPGQARGPSAPYLGDTAGQWWKDVAQAGYIVREMHFNARYIYAAGPIVGSRLRRVAMRTALQAYLDIGIPAGRLGLLLGFQSGKGKGGREGLSPSYKWFDIVKRDALAAKQVATELGISTIWSWGWGTFNAAGADPDKPRAACVYLWTRNQSLCNGPMVAGPRFNPSLSEGQIILAPGVQCRTGAGSIRNAAVDALVPAAGNRTAALTALLTRLVTRGRGAPVRSADVAHARELVIAAQFGGDQAMYQAALEGRNLDEKLVNAVIADQFRFQAAEARLAVTDPRMPIELWVAKKVRSALATAICARDELPEQSVFDWTATLPFLEIPPASVSISAGTPVIRRGQSTELSGVVASARASEQLTVYARSGRGFQKVGKAPVGADGSWTFTVSPSSFTSYMAVSKTAASRTVAVRVTRPRHPR